MKFPCLLTIVTTLLPSLALAGDPPENARSASRRSEVIPAARANGKLQKLPPRPPAPAGVTDISFDDFFQMPVGPRGLELSVKIKSLDGKRVRIAGFQVAEMVGVCNAEPDANSPARKARAMLEASVSGRLMLCATPEATNFSHYGLCEDLPPQVVFVSVAELFGEMVPQHAGPLLLTGILSVGNKAEADGRVSVVRLALDPAAAPSKAALPVAPATASSFPQTQPNHIANKTP